MILTCLTGALRLSAPQSKMKIEGILAQYGIKDTGWRWDLEGNEVFVGFTLEENVNGQLLKTFVRVDAPLIWKRARIWRAWS